MSESNCYGDGTVYRGVRSSDGSSATHECEDYLKRILDETVAENEVLVKEITSLRQQLSTQKMMYEVVTNQAKEFSDLMNKQLAEAKVDADRYRKYRKLAGCGETFDALTDAMEESKDADA